VFKNIQRFDDPLLGLNCVPSLCIATMTNIFLRSNYILLVAHFVLYGSTNVS